MTWARPGDRHVPATPDRDSESTKGTRRYRLVRARGVADTPGSGVWDLDCDGDYDEDDIRLAMADFGITEGTPGDADGDGDVDLDDRTAVNDALGLCAADINGDGIVDGADLSYVLGYWGLCSAP